LHKEAKELKSQPCMLGCGRKSVAHLNGGRGPPWLKIANENIGGTPLTRGVSEEGPPPRSGPIQKRDKFAGACKEHDGRFFRPGKP